MYIKRTSSLHLVSMEQKTKFGSYLKQYQNLNDYNVSQLTKIRNKNHLTSRI